MGTVIKQTLPGKDIVDWATAQQYRKPVVGRPTTGTPSSQAAHRHAHASRRNGIEAPYIASCHIATDTPALHIARLCEQFGHKLAVRYDAQQGRIEFDFGLCLLHTDPSGLHITTLSNNHKDLGKLKHAVGSHFERFAWQAPLRLDWQAFEG